MGFLSHFSKPALVLGIFLSLSILPNSVFGQGGDTLDCKFKFALSGIVLDSIDKDGLQGARITIKETEQVIRTDKEGRFSGGPLCPGTYTLITTHLGCLPQSNKVSIIDSTNVIIYLDHHSGEILPEANISAQHNGNEEISLLGSERIEVKSGQGSQPLGKLMKNLNGVWALQTGPSIFKPIVDGVHSQRLPLFAYGGRLESQNWGSDHAPEIEVFGAKSIQVLHGPRALRYAHDAVGGLVYMQGDTIPTILQKPKGEAYLSGSTNTGAIAGGIQLGGNIRKLGYLTSFSGTWAGNSATPGYRLPNSAYLEAAGRLALQRNWQKVKLKGSGSFYNTNRGVYSGAHIGNLADLERAISRGIPSETSNNLSYAIGRPNQVVGHYTGMIEAQWTITELAHIESTFGFQYNRREEYDKHPPRNNALAAKNLPELRLDLYTTNGEVSLHTVSGSHLTHRIGISGSMATNINGGRMFIPNYNAQTGGVFWNAHLNLHHKLIEWTLRYDLHKMNARLTSPTEPAMFQKTWQGPTGAISLEGSPLPYLTYSTSLSYAFRAPAPNELFSSGLHHGAAAVEYGDMNLRKEQSLDGRFTLAYFKDGWTVNANVFAKPSLDFISLYPQQPPTVTVRGVFPTFRFEARDALFYGTNLGIGYLPIKGIGAYAKYASVRGKELNNDKDLPGIPADRLVLNLNGTTSLRKTNTLKVEVSGTWVERQYRMRGISDFSPSPKAYVLLGAGLNYKLKDKLILSIQGENLLNTRYRDYLDRFRYYNDAQGRIISTSLTLKLN